MKHILIASLIILAIACSKNQEEKTAYIFPTFTGNGEDGLHLLGSYDGYNWEDVDSFKTVYLQEEGLMRDPSICIGGDGKYHMTHTTEWFDHRIAITHSEDLINWTPTEFLYVWHDYKGIGSEESDGSEWDGDNLNKPARRDSLVKNCWSPTIFYDDQTEEYIIFWSTSIDHPDVFPESWNPEAWERMNQKIYYIVTKDFSTYSPRKLFYAPKNNQVIDAFVAKVDNENYVMGIKEETLQQLHVVKSRKKLDTWLNMPAGFWEDISETKPFAGRYVPGNMKRAEGNAIFKVEDYWLIYCDYWWDKLNGAFITRDFETFTDITNQVNLPRWVRNGKIFEVPEIVVRRLLNYKTEGPGITVEPIPQAKWK